MRLGYYTDDSEETVEFATFAGRNPYRSVEENLDDFQTVFGEFCREAASPPHSGVTYAAVIPPSTRKFAPVMKEDSAEAR